MGAIGILILILSFIVLLLLGVPIAFSIGIASVLTMLASIDSLPAFATYAQRMAGGLDSFALLAIPFFILAGNIMNKGGIATRLVDLARAVVGRAPGGLAMVNVLANMLFGAISGSAAASASAIGTIMTPEMDKEGYPRPYSAAVNITSSTTGLSIPPSNVLIVYSLASGGVSIGALFVAGYLPGILTGVFLIIASIGLLLYRRGGISSVKPWLFKMLLGLLAIGGFVLLITQLVDWRPARQIIFGVSGITALFLWLHKMSLGWKVVLKTFFRALPSLFLLIVVIGGIIAGYFTATEASAIAVLYAWLLALYYKEMHISDTSGVLLDSVKTTAIVLFLVSTGIGLSWIMAYENIPQSVSTALLQLSDNPIVILLIINFILLLVGTFMDMTPAILIFTPIFLPIATGQLGIHPVHFGIMLIMNLSIGLCTPPVGSVLFVGCSVARVKISDVIKPLLPMYLAMILALLLVIFLPQVSLWLPRIMELL